MSYATGLGVQNNNVPPEGPKSIPVTLPLATQNPVTVNLTQAMYQGQISMIQSAFIDNSQNTASLSIYIPVTQQTITIPPESQAYVPLLSPNPPVFTFSSTGGVNVQVQINNFSMPLQIWSVSGSGGSTSFKFDTSGNLYTHDAYLDALISSGALNVRPTLNGYDDNPIPAYGAGRAYSGTITAGNTQTIIFTTGTGAFINSACVYVTPDAEAGSVEDIVCSITAGSDTFWQAPIRVGTTAPSPTLPQNIPLLQMSGFTWLSRGGGNGFVINLSAALTNGTIYYAVNGGITATIGN